MIAALEDLLLAAVQIQSMLLRQNWRFCFIGGIAVQRWSNPRFTRDIDLTLVTGFGGEEKYVDVLLRELEPRQPDARAFALSRRVLLARTAAGVEVDIALGAIPFELRSADRASLWRLRADIALTTCSAEDLVVHKVFAGRDRDWGDVEEILTRQHGKLDLTQVRAELIPLLELKDDTDALPKLERMLATVARRLRAP